VTISKLMAAAGIAAASFVGFGGVALAAPASSDAAVSCVTGDVSCAAPACADGALSIVTDDAGVQHEACVASAPDAPLVPVVTPERVLLAPVSTGSATSTTTPPASLPKTGAGIGVVLIAAILVGTGSVASLIARRKSS
jgi:LPXTG-motif cell wall-anchored protein